MHLFDCQGRGADKAGADKDTSLLEGQAEDHAVSVVAVRLRPPAYFQRPRPIAQVGALQLWWEPPLNL